jgi:hypothetical protein
MDVSNLWLLQQLQRCPSSKGWLNGNATELMDQPQVTANISQLLEATISPDTNIIKSVCPSHLPQTTHLSCSTGESKS